jgi:hypothetical protein
MVLSVSQEKSFALGSAWRTLGEHMDLVKNIKQKTKEN